MPSTVSRGLYYRTKTKKYLESLGYKVELTEFMTARPVGGGRILYAKKDVFGSDGIAMNGETVIFWNSKHYTTEESKKQQIRKACSIYRKYPFPNCIKVVLYIWKPRKKTPEILEISS